MTFFSFYRVLRHFTLLKTHGGSHPVAPQSSSSHERRWSKDLRHPVCFNSVTSLEYAGSHLSRMHKQPRKRKETAGSSHRRRSCETSEEGPGPCCLYTLPHTTLLGWLAAWGKHTCHDYSKAEILISGGSMSLIQWYGWVWWIRFLDHPRFFRYNFPPKVSKITLFLDFRDVLGKLPYIYVLGGGR